MLPPTTLSSHQLRNPPLIDLGFRDVDAAASDKIIYCHDCLEPRAVGADRSQMLIASAQSRHADSGCEFVVTDAADLPFPEGSFGSAAPSSTLPIRAGSSGRWSALPSEAPWCAAPS